MADTAADRALLERAYSVGLAVGLKGIAAGIALAGGALRTGTQRSIRGVATPELCFAECESRPGCVQFVHKMPLGQAYPQAQCYLKTADAVPYRRTKLGSRPSASGIVRLPSRAAAAVRSPEAADLAPALHRTHGCPPHPVADEVHTAIARAAALGQWPRRSSESAIRICEINHVDASLPAALLCAAGNSSSAYLGITFVLKSGAVFQRTVPQSQQPPCPEGRCELRYGPPVFTVQFPRADVKARPKPGSCDVVLVNMDAETPISRQALAFDIPRVLRFASESAVVIMHGSNCTKKGSAGYFRSEWTPFPIPVWCWHQRALELARSGAVRHVACRGISSQSSRKICTGIALGRQDSVCTAKPALLGPNVDRVRVRVPASIGHSHRRSHRYFSALPCRHPVQVPSRPGVQFVRHNASNEDEPPWAELTAPLPLSELTGTSSTPIPAKQVDGVCLTFKNAIYETQVQVISSANGIDFGSPDVVLPRVLNVLTRQPRTCDSIVREERRIAGTMYAPSVVESRMPKILAIPRVQKLCASNGSGTGEEARLRWTGKINLTPNMAIAVVNGSYVVVGGLHRVKANMRSGIWMTRSTSLSFAPGSAALASMRFDWRRPITPRAPYWESPRWLMDGMQEGCVEERETHWLHAAKTCEFDGRLSLVFHRGSYLIYARANPAKRGQRFVQVTKSADELATTWSPFQMVRIRDYAYQTGNIYFFGVQTNPVMADSLVAVFPMVHQLSGCLGIAASRDGLRWTSATPLINCEAHGDRTVQHPAAPALVVDPQDKSMLLMYVHEDVPGINEDAFMPGSISAYLGRRAPASKVVRYRIPTQVLTAWTRSALAELDG